MVLKSGYDLSNRTNLCKFSLQISVLLQNISCIIIYYLTLFHGR